VAEVTCQVAWPAVTSDDGVAAGEPTEGFNLSQTSCPRTRCRVSKVVQPRSRSKRWKASRCRAGKIRRGLGSPRASPLNEGLSGSPPGLGQRLRRERWWIDDGSGSNILPHSFQ
jgi:hypothetical protein